MNVYEFIEENPEESEEVFLNSGFRECRIELDDDQIKINLVKNTRQRGTVTIFQDGTFDSPHSLKAYESVRLAIRSLERMAQE